MPPGPKEVIKYPSIRFRGEIGVAPQRGAARESGAGHNRSCTRLRCAVCGDGAGLPARGQP